MCRPSCWSNFLSFSKNVGKGRKMLKILKSELRWYLHARACLLLACLLACTQKLLASNCESCWWVQVPLYASGKVLESFEPTWGIFRGNLCIVWPHVSRTGPQRFLHHPHQTHPQFSKDCSFNVSDPKKCVQGPPREVYLRSQEMCGRSQEMGVRSPQEMWMSRSQDMCARFQQIGCEVFPKKCVWGPKQCVQGLKKCERSQEMCARSQEMWEVLRNVG
jgi:hypothetical protein